MLHEPSSNPSWQDMIKSVNMHFKRRIQCILHSLTSVPGASALSFQLLQQLLPPNHGAPTPSYTMISKCEISFWRSTKCIRSSLGIRKTRISSSLQHAVVVLATDYYSATRGANRGNYLCVCIICIREWARPWWFFQGSLHASLQHTWQSNWGQAIPLCIPLC
jgi:hypothetical protein